MHVEIKVSEFRRKLRSLYIVSLQAFFFDVCRFAKNSRVVPRNSTKTSKRFLTSWTATYGVAMTTLTALKQRSGHHIIYFG